MTDNRDADASRLAAESIARNDPTGWFEQLYTEAATGAAVVPWEREYPNPLLVDWAEQEQVDGTGRRALVVGCGLGQDSEYVATLGFATTAFDISRSAVAQVRDRFPQSPVDYVTADLLNPPPIWREAFDLVVEAITVQSMPVSVRATAIRHLGQFVAPAGELLVISGIRDEGAHVDGPPWPLTRSEIESFAVDGLRAVTIDRRAPSDIPGALRWLANFRRAEPI